MRIADTHAHYDDEAFDADREELLGHALEDGGVQLVVNMGASMEGADRSVKLAQWYDFVYAGCGIHPDEVGVFEEGACSAAGAGSAADADGEADADGAGETGDAANAGSAAGADSAAGAGCATGADSAAGAGRGGGADKGSTPDENRTGLSGRAAWDHLCSLLSQPKVVCVGEIGLDYHWMVQPKEIQQKWFRRQMELAAELHLPVNIHSREAAQDTFDIIKAQYLAEGGTERILSTSAGTAVRVLEKAAVLPGSGTGPAHAGGIIHCYSGSLEMAREYVKMGYHIGIGGVVTFKSAKTLKKVVADIPLEMIVTETDCPYMAPEPHRGTRNDSRNIRYVIETIAALRGMDAGECAEILFRNGHEVYGLQEAD